VVHTPLPKLEKKRCGQARWYGALSEREKTAPNVCVISLPTDALSWVGEEKKPSLAVANYGNKTSAIKYIYKHVYIRDQ
jgi:hypothetical protein